MHTAKPSPRARERIARQHTEFLYTVACVNAFSTVLEYARLKSANMHDAAKRIARTKRPGALAYIVRDVERV